MQLVLHPHPATPPAEPFELWASVEHAAAFGAMATVNIWFGVGAPVGRFVIPEAGDNQQRIDGLWQTTCFEAFLSTDGSQAYREWNFAPSGDWAAYDFTGPREGMTSPTVDRPPYIRMEDNFTWWTLGATIAVEAGKHWQLGLSSVIEEQDGTKSYWALAHVGDVPDFHHPDCFIAKLA